MKFFIENFYSKLSVLPEQNTRHVPSQTSITTEKTETWDSSRGFEAVLTGTGMRQSLVITGFIPYQQLLVVSKFRHFQNLKFIQNQLFVHFTILHHTRVLSCNSSRKYLEKVVNQNLLRHSKYFSFWLLLNQLERAVKFQIGRQRWSVPEHKPPGGCK